MEIPFKTIQKEVAGPYVCLLWDFWNTSWMVLPTMGWKEVQDVNEGDDFELMLEIPE